MKDEIKEIIRKRKQKIELNKSLNVQGYYDEEDELLLDYITNLQKSQETLIKNDNEIITNLQEENKVLLEKYSTIQILYNSSKLKNDKAIKYIKEHIRIDDEYPAYMEMLVEEKDELLNILQGGDK